MPCQTTTAHVQGLYLVSLCTLKKGELLEEPRSHKGVCEAEQEATEEQPCRAGVDRVGLGTGETQRRLQEPTRELEES